MYYIQTILSQVGDLHVIYIYIYVNTHTHTYTHTHVHYLQMECSTMSLVFSLPKVDRKTLYQIMTAAPTLEAVVLAVQVVYEPSSGPHGAWHESGL